ncbi:MAG TPA: hypothetical protein VI112_01870 [Bacteroidia bacterium]|jgi:hypothetical protein
MLKLKDVIAQMKEDQYEKLLSQLKGNSAEKFHSLATYLRDDKMDDEDIMGKLGVNTSAYYTLKSRLYKRVGEFLSAGLDGSKTDLLKKVATIPDLVYNTKKETAVAVLGKLEKDLLTHDLPYELTDVYSALKKLHITSPKYYDYAQAYNRHLGYTIALDKAEDVLSSFMKYLGEYDNSRNADTHELMKMMKQEMASLCRLYQSHHLTVYRNILDVSFALFVPLSEAVKDDEPIEDILTATEKIMDSYPADSSYRYLQQVIAFLRFEYYHQAMQHKKAEQYYDMVNSNLSMFLNFNFCCYSSVFFLSRIQRAIRLNETAALSEENKELLKDFQPEKHDVPAYLNYVRYTAASLFYAGKYAEAAAQLNNVLNEIVFKNMAHAEIEIKLFFVLCCSMQNKYDTAHTVLKNVARKIRELENKHEYENANALIKMLSLQMDSGTGNKEKKMAEFRDKFLLLNRGRSNMLCYLDLSDNFLKKLGKNVK